MSKKKLEEHTRRLQKIVEELKRKNYYLEQEGKVLRGLVENYKGQYRVLKDFALMVFIFEKLIIGLYFVSIVSLVTAAAIT